MNRIRLVIFALLGSLGLEAAPGYSIRSWGLEEGLPSSQVVAIDQTSDGRLWLATSRGLCVYDGLVFETYTHARHPELGTSDLQSMAVGPNDYVWFVDRSGRVGYFDGLAFHERPLSSLSAEDQVRNIVVSEEGLVLGSTRNSALIELYPHTPTVLRRSREWFELERDFSPEIQMRFDSDDRLLAGLHTELIQWAPDGLVRILPELHVDTSENRAWLWALGSASEAGVWVAADLQIRRYAKGTWVENRGGFPWGDNSKITSLLQTRDGVVWVGSHEHGLWGMRDASPPIVITREEGLPSDSVSSLFEDQEGNLWVGLDGGGIARIRSRLFENFGDGMGLGNVRVNGLVEDRTHDLWLATDGDGLIHWNGFAFRSVFRLDKPEVNVVLADSQGRVWAGTRDRGLHLVYPERTSDEGYKTEAALGFENGTIVSLYESLNGDIWVAGERRVGRIDGADPLRAPVFPFEDLGGVRCMLEDSLGNLWLGTLGRGLYRWRAGQLDQFTLEEGLPDNSIVSMCRDNAGRVIVGTRGAGIFRINGAKFETLSDGGSAVDSYVAGLANDHRGSLWLSTSRGISRIPWEDVDQNFTLQAGRLRRENYSKEDGLVSLEGQDRFHPSILVSELGKMYFPLKGGVAQIALDDLSKSQLWFPPVSIRSLVVDGSEVPVLEDHGRMVAECYPGSRRIEIRFSGVGLSAPEKVIFRYRIDGEKAPWTSLGDAHSVSFLELDAGSYDIEVSAALQSGEWNPEPAKLLLKVLPYWWETVWAKSGALLAILALIVGAISLYARRRIRAEASQRELERAVHRERERIAQDMHDDLGARLTQLSFQGEMAKRSLTDEKSASGNLDRVVEGVRQTAQALDDIVWMTNPRNDTLSRLISHLAQVASELAESADWVLELSLPDSIPSRAVGGQLRHEIVMVFKEALNNASKHSECSRIRLNIHLDSNLLVFEVADDGKGFDVAGSRDRGNGLVQMKTRTERVGGQISWESESGQGTRVEVRIQLSHPMREGC